jgi:hypothetical protein
MMRHGICAPAVCAVACGSIAVASHARLTVGACEAACVGDGAARDAAPNLRALLGEHDDARNAYVERFRGRSIFFVPPALVSPAATIDLDPRADEDKGREVVVPPSPRLPPVTGVVGERVWFAGPPHALVVGETWEGNRLLAVDCPWSITVLRDGAREAMTIFARGEWPEDESPSPISR